MLKYAYITHKYIYRHLEMLYGVVVAWGLGWEAGEVPERLQSTAKVPLSKGTKLPVRDSLLTLCHLSLNAHACVLRVFEITKGVCHWISSCGINKV